MALTHITLRDFVIVHALELDLSQGFTVLTGETGAGKSILIDALQLALGVAIWILPRFSGPRRHGRIELAWAACVLINAGVRLALVGLLGRVDGLLALGRALQPRLLAIQHSVGIICSRFDLDKSIDLCNAEVLHRCDS